MIDLNPRYLERVQHILTEHAAECEVRAYGSRVTWTAKDYSDLDLAIIGKEPLGPRRMRQLQEAFEESDLPIRVDVVDWNMISDSFKKVIMVEYEVIQNGESAGYIAKSTGFHAESSAISVNSVTKLSSVTKAIVDCEHKTAPTEASGIPSIRTSDIKNGRLDLQSANKVSEETYNEWTKRLEPRPGDLILSREAPVGEVGIVPEGVKVCLGQRTVLVRPNREKVVPRYLLYRLLTREMRHEMTSRAEGSIVPHLNMSDIRDFEIPSLPPLEEQCRISYILGSLDDKIELNRQMNETLEATARAIFKSWFVDFDPVRAKMEGWEPVGIDDETAALFPYAFQDSLLGEIPVGWETSKFANVIEIMLGGDWGKVGKLGNWSCRTLCIRGADIPVLQTGGLGNMPVRYLKTSSLSKRQLQSGDLVIEISGGSPAQSTGRTILIDEELLNELDCPLVCSNFCRFIRVKSRNMSILVYLWLRWHYSNDTFLQYENGTTGIKNLAFTVFAEEQDILIPTDPVINAFNQKIEPLLKMLQLNSQQSRTLSEIREALLPKLLSGEIRVN